MARIKIKDISKRYKTVVALSDVSFEVYDKEFVVLFGPAGAGKTTLLSIIAGFLCCEKGSVSFNNTVVDHLPPNKRNVAMVFENYALYPHFTVYENIAFPLRSPEYQQEERDIERAVYAITKKMNIAHLLHRFPAQLSNGQRQRVALGRALVRKPNVFLMDEPLAHLDAKLKNVMRTELKEIQQQLNTTTIYVTHDYLEALSLGDKIVIIDKGSIVQVGSPNEIYYMPCNTFVAKLVGEPEINLYTCAIENNKLLFSPASMSVSMDAKTHAALSKRGIEERVIVGVRGVDVDVAFTATRGYKQASVLGFYSIGNRFVINVDCEGLIMNALVSSDHVPTIDGVVFVRIKKELLFFDPHDEGFITRMGDDV